MTAMSKKLNFGSKQTKMVLTILIQQLLRSTIELHKCEKDKYKGKKFGHF